MLQKPKHSRRGFTLVEVMIVIGIIALLAAVAVPNFLRARKRGQATHCLEDLRVIDSACDQYAIEYNKVTGNTVAWADAQNYMKTGSFLYNSQGFDIFGNAYNGNATFSVIRSRSSTPPPSANSPTWRRPPLVALLSLIREQVRLNAGHSQLSFPVISGSGQLLFLLRAAGIGLQRGGAQNCRRAAMGWDSRPLSKPRLPSSIPPLNSGAMDHQQNLHFARAQTKKFFKNAKPPTHCTTVVRELHKRLEMLSAVVMEERNVKLACREGCSFCCHLRVDAYAHEVLYAADFIRAHLSAAQIDGIVARSKAHGKKIGAMNAAQQMCSNNPCPLLVESRCSAHGGRPMSCRNHHAIDVATCEHFFKLATQTHPPHAMSPYTKTPTMSGWG